MRKFFVNMDEKPNGRKHGSELGAWKKDGIYHLKFDSQDIHKCKTFFQISIHEIETFQRMKTKFHPLILNSGDTD